MSAAVRRPQVGESAKKATDPQTSQREAPSLTMVRSVSEWETTQTASWTARRAQ